MADGRRVGAPERALAGGVDSGLGAGGVGADTG